MKISVSLAALSVVALAAGSASAAEVGFAGNLLPGNEVTAPDTGAHAPNGGAVFLYNDQTKTLCGRIEFDDLTGAATGIHVHLAPKGMPNADGSATDKVIIPIAASPVTFKVVLPAAWETGLMVGEIYANVHTATNAKGEIRGSLDPFPEYPGGAAPVVCPATALQIGTPAADAGTDGGNTSSSTSSTSSSSTSSSGATSSGDTSSSSSSGSKPPITDPEEPAPAESGGCSTAASTPASLASAAVLAGLALAGLRSRGRRRKK